jgi:hypothetical protein
MQKKRYLVEIKEIKRSVVPVEAFNETVAMDRAEDLIERFPSKFTKGEIEIEVEAELDE